jgi:hypothetical protein
MIKILPGISYLLDMRKFEEWEHMIDNETDWLTNAQGEIAHEMPCIIQKYNETRGTVSIVNLWPDGEIIDMWYISEEELRASVIRRIIPQKELLERIPNGE